MSKYLNLSLKPSFPTFGDKNIGLYYLLTIFLNACFILPNWVFYFGRFIAIPAIALIDGLSKLVAVVLEVPSGAFSDLFGKKVTLIFGCLAHAICCLVLINANSFTTLLVGNIIMFVGFALISGAKEAILYDSLLDIKKEGEYDNVLGKVNTITIITTILTIFAGGLLYSISPELTFWAWFVFSILGIIVLMNMREPKSETKEEVVSRRHYFAKIADGTKSIFNHSFLGFILPVLFFAMLIKAYEGVIRQNTGAYFGFTGETFGYLMALISIPTIAISYNFGKIKEKFKDSTEYIFIFLYIIGFTIVYLTSSMIWGIASFVAVYAAQEIAKPFITSMVNKNTPSSHRATALSTVSLLSEIPYMIIVIFFGTLLTVDNINYLYLIFALVVVAYTVVRVLYKTRHKSLPS